MLQKLIDAGDAAMEWLQAAMAADGSVMARLGIPQTAGGATKAPYDILGDTMRGTRGLMLDKFRQPDKIKAAMERLVPQAIDWAVRSNNMTGNPIVFIPIHKGADGFMSDADFKELYWPTFKAVLLGLIEEGLVPWVFVEGSYNERLEVIADEDIPAHRMVWMFDATDMERAKAIVGKRQCIGGNVPAALFAMGTTEEMDAYVKDLLGKTAGDGGFILSSGIVLDEADPAAYRAFIEAGREVRRRGLTGAGPPRRSGVRDGPSRDGGGPARVPRRHHMLRPPSTRMVWQVMKSLSGDARKKAGPGEVVGHLVPRQGALLAHRHRGARDARPRARSARRSWCSPGARALTRMPNGPSSRPSARVKPITPPLLEV